MVNDDAGSDTDVEGMLGAILRNLYAGITGIDHLLLHAFDLVAEDDGILLARFDTEIVEHGAVLALFYGDELVALAAQPRHRVHRVFEIAPGDAVLGAECGLVDFGIGRCGGDATEDDTGDPEGIGGAKHGPHIVETADAVEHDYKRTFLRLAKLLDAHAPHLGDFKFTEHQLLIIL